MLAQNERSPRPTALPPLAVYFDGKCGLCAREISYYQRIAPAGAFDWRDVARDRAALEPLGVSQADALRQLHAQDAQGAVYVGVDAFIAIWRRLRWWRRLAPIVGAPIIRPCAQWLYRRFAAWRFSRLDHCQIALKEDAR